MYISKSLIAAVAIVGAIVIGWISRDALDQVTAAEPAAILTSATSVGVAAPPDDAQPVDASTTQPVPSPSAAASAVTPPGGTTNVYLTIVNTPSETTATVPTIAPARAEAPDRSNPTGKPAGTSARAAGGHAGGQNGASRGSSGRGAAVTSAAPTAARTTQRDPQATSTTSTAPLASSVAQDVILQLSAGLAMTAVGEHIVIAHDGSIVYVGDNGYLNGNTGDAVQGGTVALDAQGSTFSSNHGPIAASPAAGSPDVGAGSGSRVNAPSTASNVSSAAGSLAGPGATPAEGTGSAWSPVTAWSGAAGPGTMAGGNPWAIPTDASPLVSAFNAYTANRTADIAGYEDHSVLTRGMGNVVTYDDSNVFINRDGKINGNTGDTDSAGLNAVAVVGSTVKAGPHCDDGCDDESIIQAEAGVFDEGDVGVDGNGNVVWSPDIVAERPTVNVNCDDPAETNDDGCDDSLPADDGSDTDAAGDESPDGDVSDPVEPAETLEEADSTRAAADNGPEPVGQPDTGSLTVGGDGIDDLSERVDGVGNVSTYDDSNVVIGGSGDVNAQIGDSDTGGTVVMDIVDSLVAGGNSR